ncbi:TolC family protein [Parapedobacter sp. ISTM3]|uniref:Efflux transporter, outer membrane factor (OMF) lipoprotein, NodT family n=1 Tax=Parapedobacter luteus TaxID=623280 RepID=A0A1T5A0Z9_9SPHI|nr:MULTISPECIES: TolC family protein [Parapedobacter]MBK1440021.1 TolC family protein [Parapedobacter sp. ISTM3]SKB28704.1 efflux transporter, outer membrane factor (OMF) lipoprotein, NodT family [Parapedobacter luteus]
MMNFLLIKIPHWLCLTALLFITSCKAPQEGVQASAGLPESYRNAPAPSADTTDTLGIAHLPKTDYFSDSILLTLLDTAVAQNNDLQLAVKNIEIASRILSQARLAYLPSVGLALTGSTTRPSNNSLNGISLNQFLGNKHIEDYNASVSFSWELDIWGKIRNQKAAALASYLQTEEARKAVETQLVTNVAYAYYNLLALREQLTIAKRSLALNDTTLNLIKLQYEVGEATLLALEQAEAQRLSAATLIPLYEQEINIQENALSILLGKMPAAVFTAAHLADIAVPDRVSAGIPSVLLSRRPDVHAAELGVRIADAQMRQARANMYPSLTITAQGGVNTFTASNWFTIPASLFGAVAGGITQPIFHNRRLKTAYEVSRIEREKSVIQFRQSMLVAVGEVADALIKIEKLKARSVLAAEKVTRLRNAVNNANSLYTNGVANYLEVITAQNNMLQSELELTDVKRLHLEALADLYRAVGGGWQ